MKRMKVVLFFAIVAWFSFGGFSSSPHASKAVFSSSFAARVGQVY